MEDHENDKHQNEEHVSRKRVDYPVTFMNDLPSAVMIVKNMQQRLLPDQL